MEKETVYQVIISEQQEGRRIDQLLSESFAELSRSFLQKLIKDGFITVDGKVCTSKKLLLKKQQNVEIRVPEPEILHVEAEDIPLDIRYEDDDLLIVNKPRGMVVHPAAGNYSGTLVNAVMHHCGDRLSSINGIIRPGIVHRIDKDTSGLLMIAKNDAAHRLLAQQLAEHSITRAYRAIVYNNFKEDEGTVDAPIGRDPKNRLRQAVTQTNSKRAVTHYRVLERLGAFTYIEARLETGRTHQIRVHMAHIRHPLVGDPLYGPSKNPFGINGQLLHARLLGFQHPATGAYMEFESEPPEEFRQVLDKLKRGV
ncbi:MAG: RluA family pseudouridine synthase [Firmicutes bacterium]|nr:RluA family pseudouridine synthase [Bacillota bacterium]